MSGRPHRGDLSVLCLWCLLAVLVEVGLYASYQGHDARFHWFTHFFVGASTALLVMAGVAWRSPRPVPQPLVWPLLGHLVAMTPDFLFIGGIAHRRWMDVFLGHISSHYVPGRNLTWYVVFAVSLAVYLGVLAGFAVDRLAGPDFTRSGPLIRRINRDERNALTRPDQAVDDVGDRGLR